MTMTTDAGFSRCGHYRWWLRRQWQPALPPLVFIGLNPSRADGQRDDPTIRRIVGFARSWGFGSVTVLNLFARISPSPALLKRCGDPVGPKNDACLQQALLLWASANDESALWLGWGNQGAWQGRDQVLHTLLQGTPLRRPVLVLGLTALGQPRHPLYAPAATQAVHLPLPLAQTARTGASCGQRATPPWPAPRAVMPSTCI